MHYIPPAIYNSNTGRNRDYNIRPISNRKYQGPNRSEAYIIIINTYYLLNTSSIYIDYAREIEKWRKIYR